MITRVLSFTEEGVMGGEPVAGAGTKEDPWTLKTPSGQSEFVAYRDGSLDPPAVVVSTRVRSTVPYGTPAQVLPLPGGHGIG